MAELFADRLRRSRLRYPLTQQELADAAGLALMTVNRLEIGGSAAGQRNPRPGTVRALASALGVSPQWLIDGDAGDNETTVQE